MSQENFWNGGDPNSWPNWEPALLVPGVDPEEALASWRELEARDRRLLDRGREVRLHEPGGALREHDRPRRPL